jgi:hypothetical protein
MTSVTLLAIGLFAGVLSGIFGIGGGIVIVPALIFIVKMTPQQASGTSLAALLLPVGALGAYTYHKAGQLQWGPAMLVALGLFIGVAGGATLAQHIDANSLRKGFAVFLALVAVKMWMS